MRYWLLAIWIALAGVGPASAQLSFGFSSGGVSIGINVPVYPRLVRVPGYPVYYAPGLPTNYFFYDGLYWVFQNGDWYESSWYNGPWTVVPPDAVPLYVLRVPVRYYRRPPAFFHGWAPGAPPRWDEHWGAGWAEHHRDWNHWDRRHVPSAAPLPSYQRQYSGNRYPRTEEQARSHERSYRYQPRDQSVREHWQGGAQPQRQERSSADVNRGREQHAAPAARQERSRPEHAAPQARPEHAAPQAHEQRGSSRPEQPDPVQKYGSGG